MASIQFFGGCREVGRSAYLLDTGAEKILMDYGVKLNSPSEGEGSVSKPQKPGLKIDGVLLTHCHLDHSGLIPALYSRGYHGNVYSTGITFDLSRTLYEDSIKLAKRKGKKQDFLKKDLETMERYERRVTYGQTFPIHTSNVSVHGTGHIPGSCSFVVDTRDKRVMYTGDMNTLDTRLMKGMDVNFPDIDVLLTESTYSQENHDPREELEKDFISGVKERLLKDGTVIVPAFAIGRSQEMLMILRKYGIKAPVYLDGMAVEATKKILRYPEFLRKPKELKKAYHDAKTLSSDSDRRDAVEGPSVIVTTSGMLGGGPFAYYIKQIYSNSNCSIFLTGYQVEGTPGRKLLETGVYESGGDELDVQCEYDLFDFSAHSGRDELFKFIEKVDPNKVLAVHGDENKKFAGELREKGFDASSPTKGDKLKL